MIRQEKESEIVDKFRMHITRNWRMVLTVSPYAPPSTLADFTHSHTFHDHRRLSLRAGCHNLNYHYDRKYRGNGDGDGDDGDGGGPRRERYDSSVNEEAATTQRKTRSSSRSSTNCQLLHSVLRVWYESGFSRMRNERGPRKVPSSGRKR